MMKRVTSWAMLSTLALLLTGNAWAGRHNEVLSIGDAAPTFSLSGTDGKTYSLDEFKDASAVVVVFSCNSCPAARGYEERLGKFADDFAGQGVRVVAIHVHRGESMEDAANYAKEAKFRYPYLHDEEQAVAKAYGAKTTPHAFVLDQNRRIAYMGAIDDQMNPEKVEQAYLRDAVQAVLGGQTPELSETLPFGCSIKWK